MTLRIAGGRDDRIGRDESRQLGIVVPGAVIVEAVLRIELLAGEAVLGVYVAFASADLAPGIVFVELLSRRVVSGIVVGDDVDTAQMVVVVEEFRCSAGCGTLLRCQKL